MGLQARKKPTTQTKPEAESEVNDAAKTEVAPEAESEVKPTPPAPKQVKKAGNSSDLVKVKVVKGSYYRQPSTGVYLRSNVTVEVKNDSWLQCQIDAGLVKLV